jgi:sorting nexin-29
MRTTYNRSGNGSSKIKYKAPGTDNIPAELLKYGGNGLVKHLHTIIKEIWLKEKMPTDCNLSIICPTHKKGDIMECLNYRGVSLLNTAYKILSNILFTRISPFAENIIGKWFLEEQIYNKPDIYTKTDIGKDVRVWY